MTPATTRKTRALPRLGDARAARAEDALRPRGERGKKQAGREFGRVAREKAWKRLGLEGEPKALRSKEREALNKELHSDAHAGELEKVERALARGAQVDAPSSEGWTALHLAAFMGHAPIVSLLIDSGANVHQRDDRGHSPLHNAAQRGHMDAAQILVDHGALVDFFNNTHNTPLHQAAFNNQLYMVKFLLDHGANPNLKNNDGRTPLDMTSLQPDAKVAWIIRQRLKRAMTPAQTPPQKTSAPPAPAKSVRATLKRWLSKRRGRA